MSYLSFFIKCVPPTATAQQKGVFIAGGKPRFFKKAKVKAAENTLHALLLPHRPPAPLDGPLEVIVAFYFPWRKSESKKLLAAFRNYPIATRPDVDNIFKALADVMTTLRFWNDDGQIADLRVSKHYGDNPGIAITILRAKGVPKL